MIENKEKRMILFTHVRLVLEENPERGIPGVELVLYDRDEGDEDDRLASGVTDDRGEVLFKFDSKSYMDTEDQDQWRIDSLPDLYIVAIDKLGEVILSSRSQAMQNQIPDLITIQVSQSLADKHGLLDANQK
jgi:hypothetical protein